MFAAAAHYTHSLVRKRGNNNNCLLTSPRNDPKAFTFDPKRLERVRSAAARAESERRRKEVEIERRLDREEAAAAGFEKERLSQAIEQATFGGRGNNGAVVMSSQRDMMSLDRPSPGTSQLPLPFRQQQPQPPQQPFISSVLVLINLLPNAEDPEEYDEVLTEVSAECSDFGSVVEVFAPRSSEGDDAGVGKVFVEFASEVDAARAAAGIAGRDFDGRTVLAAFLDEGAFDEGRLDDHSPPTDGSGGGGGALNLL